MSVVDHVGFAVVDYQRSKTFYEEALAPLGMKLLMEFSEAAAGFGKDGSRPAFFIEAHGEPFVGGFTLPWARRLGQRWTLSTSQR